MNEPENRPHILEDLVEPINQYLHVPIAAPIVKLLQRTPVTPNLVTYASHSSRINFGLSIQSRHRINHVSGGAFVGGGPDSGLC